MNLDPDRIEAAVDAAEEGSRGEIVCIIAHEVSRYREIPLAWGAVAALVVPPIALALGLRPLVLAAQGADWTVAHAGAVESQIALALAAYAIAQGVLFAVVAFVAAIPPVRRLLTPRFLKRRRVRQAAERQYAAIAARAMGSDTGVLIFVAVDDHQVEILADAAIHAKVGAPLWERAAQAIRAGMKSADPTAGLTAAIDMCGQAMREHFPATGENPNFVPNRPVII
jgi:putative membrane protein